MNQNRLELIKTCFMYAPAILGVGFSIQLSKKMIKYQYVYTDLKEDVVKIHKEQLDESKPQPLLHLLQTKRKQLDPQLVKKLQIYQKWRKANIWVILYDFCSITIPCTIAVLALPRLVFTTSILFFFTSVINYSIDFEVLSGGRNKSYFPKDILPKQQKIIDIMAKISWAFIGLALMKYGVIKFQKASGKRILDDWRKKNIK